MGSGAMKRTKYIPFLVDPKSCCSGMIADPERLYHHLPRRDFLLKSQTGALHKERVSFDRNAPKSFREIMGRIIAVVHADVENCSRHRCRLLKPLWLASEGEDFS